MVLNEFNIINIGKNIEINKNIRGHGNIININDSKNLSKIDIFIHGNNNFIKISSPIAIRHLNIFIGNHIPASRTLLKIENNFSAERNINFFMQ